VGQGYASGTSASGAELNYFFNTTALYLSSSYDSLDIIASNKKLSVGAASHMGDGDYYDGKVYAPLEHWTSCSVSDAPVVIVTFDGTTLKNDYSADISAYQSEASSVAIDTDTNEAIVSDYCDNSKIYVYGMSDWKLNRTIPLAMPVSSIQGIAYNQNFLYIADTYGHLYGLCLSDYSMRLLFTATMRGEYEGIDFRNGELRWLLNPKTGSYFLYRYSPY
jgi:hypothetical protein